VKRLISDPVENWLGRMGSEQTKQAYRRRLAIFCDWCNLHPEQLLALKDDPNSLEAEHLLDRFVASPDFSDWQKNNLVTAVKSFYKYNYKELQRISGKVSAAIQSAYRVPTAELLRKFIKGAWNIRDKALIAFTASTFFREGTIPELNWGDVEDGAILEPNCGGKDVLHIGVMGKQMKGGGKGRYAGVEQHTFLTPEARDLLLEYKNWRERRGETITKGTPLFVREVRPFERISIETVRNLFKAASKRSGIKFSPHDFRRYGQTQLEEARLPPNWIKKILGHKVKGEENPYSRPKIKQLKQAYRGALPHIMFMSRAPTVDIDDARRKAFLDMAKTMLRGDEERLAKIEGIMEKEPDIDKAIELGGKVLAKTTLEGIVTVEEKTATNGGSQDCQRIVSEEELPNLLAQGWHVAAVLPSGKVIIEQNNNR